MVGSMHLQKKKGTVHENLEGSIERWFSPRGYGFIEIPGKGDVFVHVNDIEGLKSSDAISSFGTSHGSTINVWGHSLKGSKVRFDVVETVRGYKAKKVKIVEKGSQRSDSLHEGQRSPREPTYPEPKSNWVLPQQLEPPAAYQTSSSRESIHRARRRMEEAMNADGVPTHHVANMMRALPSASSNSYPSIRRFHKASHSDPQQAIRLNYLVIPPSSPSVLPNQLPQMSTNFLKQASPRAYSDMVKQSMGRIVQELAPDLRFFEDLVVDYIMEYAGTISLSLINFNDMMSKASRAVRYQSHMNRMPPGRRARQLAGFAHPERRDAAMMTAYGEAH